VDDLRIKEILKRIAELIGDSISYSQFNWKVNRKFPPGKSSALDKLFYMNHLAESGGFGGFVETSSSGLENGKSRLGCALYFMLAEMQRLADYGGNEIRRRVVAERRATDIKCREGLQRMGRPDAWSSRVTWL